MQEESLYNNKIVTMYNSLTHLDLDFYGSYTREPYVAIEQVIFYETGNAT